MVTVKRTVSTQLVSQYWYAKRTSSALPFFLRNASRSKKFVLTALRLLADRGRLRRVKYTMLCKPFQLFDPHQCSSLIHHARTALKCVPGTVSRRAVVNTHIRSNSVYRWNDHDHYWRWWSLFEPYTQYEPQWLEEPFQISCYAPGQSYDWHTDGVPDSNSGRSSYRSLTLTATLQNAPGAAFEFESGAVDLPVGWAVIFPSTMLHRATAPLRGRRWSFTIWCRSSCA